jgi:branched-chain amino acid transport system substrate-binding protein
MKGMRMRTSNWVYRLLGMMFVLMLVMAACSSDDDDDSGDDVKTDETTEEETSDQTSAETDQTSADGEMTDSTDDVAAPDDCTPAEPPAPTEGGGDGVLKIGTLLPETGDLAFLGPPEFAGTELAVEEINAAGGVLGKDVEIAQGDSGDTNTEIAKTTATKHLADGVDAIIGAASSGVSFTVIDQITSANVIQFSPANTSPDFTCYKDNGMYFRTAPSDVLQGRVLADALIAEGAESVFIIARQDPYGEGLLRYTQTPLDEAGVDVQTLLYDPNASEFAAEVDEMTSADADAYVVVGFAESEQILKEMITKGIGPDAKIVYGTDGNIGNALGENFPGGELAGMKGTLPMAELTDEFRDRLLKVDPALTDFTYGPESYDAVMITALAAEVAKSDDPVAIANEINGVTEGGEKCTTFADCVEKIKAGTDIDYDGIAGPFTFGPAGEPTEASFAIQEYGDDSQIDDSLTKYQFAKISG